MLQNIISGRWYLIYTNFGMWKNSSVCNVTFNYTGTQKDGIDCLLDEVKYLKHARPKAIVGYDFSDGADNNKFTWIGKGWMFWIKCPWRVEWINEAQTCIVLSFEKTLLTSGGVDIITRDKTPVKGVLEEAMEVISNNEELRKSGQNSIRVLQQ